MAEALDLLQLIAEKVYPEVGKVKEEKEAGEMAEAEANSAIKSVEEELKEEVANLKASCTPKFMVRIGILLALLGFSAC
eukprot:3873872-Ditylum_brightwellii.AAC.1